MKVLLLVSMLMMSGCFSTRNTPEFYLDQEVIITKGFYRGKMGVISNLDRCPSYDARYHDRFCYNVKVRQVIDEQLTETAVYVVQEDDMEPKN